MKEIRSSPFWSILGYPKFGKQPRDNEISTDEAAVYYALFSSHKTPRRSVQPARISAVGNFPTSQQQSGPNFQIWVCPPVGEQHLLCVCVCFILIRLPVFQCQTGAMCFFYPCLFNRNKQNYMTTIIAMHRSMIRFVWFPPQLSLLWESAKGWRIDRNHAQWVQVMGFSLLKKMHGVDGLMQPSQQC